MPDETRPSLPPLAETVLAMVDVDGIGDAAQEMHVSELTFDLPVEIAASADAGLVTALGLAPPTQIVATTVMPVFHRLRVTFAEGAGD
jgi:hypothetical protein